VFTFSNIPLKKKLVAGFVAVASITCVISAIARWNLGVLREKIADVANTHVPGIRSLGDIRLSAETFKTARRTMLNANIDRDDYRRTIERVAAARETYEGAMRQFAALKKTPEQTAIWNEFQGTWSDWQKSNDEFFRMAGDFAAILDPCVSASVPNPGRYLDQSLAAVDAARVAEIDLRKQLKVWKNILLRGDNPSDFAKYTAEFDAYTPNVHAKLDCLKTIALQIGADRKPIAEAESAYVAMVNTYKTALQELKTKDVPAFRKLDRQIRGVDQPVADALDKMIQAVAEKAKRIQDLPAALYQHAQKTCIPPEEKAMAALGKLIDNNVSLSDNGLKSAENAYQSGLIVLGTGTVVGVGLAIVLGILISLSISRPLSRCVAFAQKMAAGDLTQTIAMRRKDEIGLLMETLDAMGGSLRKMFSEITANMTSLADSANEVSGTATQLACGTEETTNQSHAVAAAAEQMSANMNSVAASTEQMSANVRVVTSSIEELTASITEVARSAEQAAEVANAAARLAGEGNDRVSELGAAANEIGKVIEVIQDIAAQTSLLALNATIEAARAGDAGKGFAVVATEVKELAKQTASATEDIRSRIETIQVSTGQAVRSIGEVAESIRKVDEVSRTIASAVEEQSITTREISRNVAETSTAAQTVARGVAESASATHEIAKNIAQVDMAAKQAAQGAASTQMAGGKVSHIAHQLTSAVAQFKLSTKRFEAAPVKTAHALWTARLSDLLAGKISLDPSEVAMHTDCKFGKWYYGEESKPLAGLPVFRAIGEGHAKFHAMAREIAELYGRGQKLEAGQRLAEARALSQKLFGLLDELERKANGQAEMDVATEQPRQRAAVARPAGSSTEPSRKLLGHVNTGA